jgi:hypothetical protein
MLSKRSLALVLLYGALLVLPSKSFGLFNGLPLNSASELILIVVGVLVLTSQSVRQFATRSLNNLSKPLFIALLFVSLSGISAKILANQTNDGGFDVCFEHIWPRKDDAPCVPSFETSPFSRLTGSRHSGLTRSESVINYTQINAENRSGLSNSNWNLPFVNDFRYDFGYRPWQENDRDIEMFSFRGKWAGTVSVPKNHEIVIKFVGSVSGQIGNVVIGPMSTYDKVSTISVPSSGTEEAFLLSFEFLSDKRLKDEPNQHYAQLMVLEKSLDDGSSKPLSPQSEPSTRMLVRLADVIVLFGAIAAFSLIVRRNIREVTLFSCVIAAFSLLSILEWRGFAFSGLPVSVPVIALAVFVAVALLANANNRFGLSIAAALPVTILMIFGEGRIILNRTPKVADVLVRTRGNDYLNYMSQVQEMLEKSFLKGAENTFYFQPGIRYILYVAHWVFGASDFIVGVFILLALFSSVIYLSVRVGRASTAALVSNLLWLLCAVLWWSSSFTVQTILISFSEFGTCILIPLVLGLAIKEKQSRFDGILAGLMCAAVIWIRPNQAFGSIALMLFYFSIVFVHSNRWRLVSAAGGAFLGFLMLIPVHNWWFGRKILFLPRGTAQVEAHPWGSFMDIFVGGPEKEWAIGQFKALLYLPSVLPIIHSRQLAIVFPIFMVLWVFAIGIAIQKRKGNLQILTGLFIGVAQAIPFLSYTLNRYYPIHLVAIYLSLAASAIAVISVIGRVDTSQH